MKAMKIKLASLYVNDLDKALRFYTEVLGLAKKADVSNGGYRWLTVASAEEQWKTLATADFGEEAYATPAIAQNKLYIRTAGHLYCFGNPPDGK